MRPLSSLLPSAPPAASVPLARGDVFFTRRITLAEGEAAAGQVSLAIEGLAPFPPEQLYFGHVASGDGRAALVFAAFRRRFDAAETETWEQAEFVTPEFVPLLVLKPANGDGIVLHVGENRITALAWRAGDDLPLVVLVREAGESDATTLVEDVRIRAALSAHVAVTRVSGELALRPAGEDAHEVFLSDQARGVLPAIRLAGADVRDPEFLIERRRARRRDEWLWRGLLGAAALLALAAVIDLGTAGWGWSTGRREAKAASQKAAVSHTETAQALANRIAELNEKRLMPFEMLTLVNPSRPDSVIFQRVVTRGLLGLEVEAQATNAEDVGSYSNALKALPALAEVRTRVDGARDGVTRFVLSLDFKPEALRNGGDQ